MLHFWLNMCHWCQQWDKVAIVKGKFRSGVRAFNETYGYIWLPEIGLVSNDEWTIEFWLNSLTKWDDLLSESPLQIGK
jgi:hypothetical protein